MLLWCLVPRETPHKSVMLPLTPLSLQSQEQKQQEKLDFEKRLNEEQRERTQLIMQNNSQKEQVLMSVREVSRG